MMTNVLMLLLTLCGSAFCTYCFSASNTNNLSLIESHVDDNEDDDEAVENDDTRSWRFIVPSDTLPFYKRKRLYADSIESFSTTNVVPWFIREPCFDVNYFEVHIGISPHERFYSLRHNIIGIVMDTFSINKLITFLEKEPVDFCQEDTTHSYHKVTTKELLEERLQEIRKNNPK